MNKFVVSFTLFCLITGVVVFSTAYVLSQYHLVDHQRYYQITGKFWKDDSGFAHTGTPSVWTTVDGYWYHLKGHKDYEADSKKEWDAMPVGSYILIEWQTFERNIR